jgi:hypothetical protein
MLWRLFFPRLSDSVDYPDASDQQRVQSHQKKLLVDELLATDTTDFTQMSTGLSRQPLVVLWIDPLRAQSSPSVCHRFFVVSCEYWAASVSRALLIVRVLLHLADVSQSIGRGSLSIGTTARFTALRSHSIGRRRVNVLRPSRVGLKSARTRAKRTHVVGHSTNASSMCFYSTAERGMTSDAVNEGRPFIRNKGHF